MSAYSNMKILADNLVKEIAIYDETKTKASSKRIRIALGGLKKITSTVRSELVAADKAS